MTPLSNPAFEGLRAADVVRLASELHSFALDSAATAARFGHSLENEAWWAGARRELPPSHGSLTVDQTLDELARKLSAEDEAWTGRQHLAPTSDKTLSQRLHEAGGRLSDNVEVVGSGTFAEFEPHNPDTVDRFARCCGRLYDIAKQLEERSPDLLRPLEFFVEQKMTGEGWAMLDGDTRRHLWMLHPALSRSASVEPRRSVLEEEELKNAKK